MKKIICVILTLVMLIPAVSVFAVPASAVYAGNWIPYSDVSYQAWYFEAVDYCYWNDLMVGVSEALFKPDMALTRGMFVTILGRLSGDRIGKYYSDFFYDVPEDSWYFNSCAWASRNGIASGTGNGYFSPDKEITRQEVCVMLGRYMKAYGGPINENTAVLNKYVDSFKIASWAKKDMAIAVNAGLMSGTTAVNLSPLWVINRASAAQIAMNLKVKYPNVCTRY